jgi:hypothetical protein
VGTIKKEIVTNYTKLLKTKGEDGLYRYMVGSGIVRATEIKSPETELLDLSDSFFCLYRASGKEEHFIIGKILRRAAHKLYRQFLKINKDKQVNAKFLNMVKL